MNAPASFERLRAPTVTELLAQHFGRHVVHWRAAEVLPAAGVLARWDAREALDAVDAASIDADGRQHQGPIVPAAIDEALAHGRTVCAQCSAWPELAPWLDTIAPVPPPLHGIVTYAAMARPEAAMYLPRPPRARGGGRS